MTMSTRFMTFSGGLILACGFLGMLSLGAAPAAAQMLGTNNNGEMFTVDTATGAAQLICNTPAFGNIGATEIEFNNMTLRGIVQGRDGSFIHQEFNPVGCVALGGQVVNNRSFNGMEWVGTNLYATGILGPCMDASLCILNPVDGSVAIIGPTHLGLPVSGLAWEAMDGIMYGITGCHMDTTSLLVRLSLTTGQATVVGDTEKYLGSLEFGVDGILYAGGNNVDGGGFYRINTNTGAATLIGPTGFSNVTGLALAEPPVPTEILSWGAIKARYGN